MASVLACGGAIPDSPQVEPGSSSSSTTEARARGDRSLSPRAEMGVEAGSSPLSAAEAVTEVTLAPSPVPATREDGSADATPGASEKSAASGVSENDLTDGNLDASQESDRSEDSGDTGQKQSRMRPSNRVVELPTATPYPNEALDTAFTEKYEFINPTGDRPFDPADYVESAPVDAIAPVYNPKYVNPGEVYRPKHGEPGKFELDPDELVMGVEINGEARAFPISLMRRREMVNGIIGGVPVLVSW